MESSKNFDVPPVLKPDVEKRVVRAFAFLRQHERKTRLARKVAELKEASTDPPSLHKPETDQEALTRELTSDEDSAEMRTGGASKNGSRENIAREIEELRRGINFKDFDTSGHITVADLSSGLRSFNHTASKAEIQWMVWEVDDDMDGCIDWDEFKSAYSRSVVDRQGTEPSQIFYLTQFLLSDPDGGGSVSVNDIVTELARIPGTERQTARIKWAFRVSTDQQEHQKHSLSEYLKAVLNELPPGFYSSSSKQ